MDLVAVVVAFDMKLFELKKNMTRIRDWIQTGVRVCVHPSLYNGEDEKTKDGKMVYALY